MVKRILLAGLVCASLALAQGGRGGYGGGGRGQQVAPGMGPMGPTAANRFEHIAMVLNLNKEQKKTVHTILEDGAKEASPLRDQMSKSRMAVGQAIAASKGQDELKQIAKTSSDLSAQLSQVEIRTFAKIYGTLDDTQKKDLKSLGSVLLMVNGMYHTKNWNQE